MSVSLRYLSVTMDAIFSVTAVQLQNFVEIETGILCRHFGVIFSNSVLCDAVWETVQRNCALII